MTHQTLTGRWAALHADSGWEVRSPRGARTHTTPNPAYARQLAAAMAGVDTLLARAVRARIIAMAPINDHAAS